MICPSNRLVADAVPPKSRCSSSGVDVRELHGLPGGGVVVVDRLLVGADWSTGGDKLLRQTGKVQQKKQERGRTE